MTAANPSRNPRYDRSERTIDVGKLFDKLPPSAIEAECALLGSMILDWRVCGEVVQIVKSPEDFYKPAHGSIYKALVELYDQVQSIDMVQLAQKLTDQGVLDKVGGVDYLIELFESVPSAVSAGHYAQLVREKALVRKLIDASATVMHDCYHTDDPADDLLNKAGQLIFKIQEKRGIDDAADLHTLLEETMEKLEAHDGRAVTGIETGFFELDEMTNGLHPGEMTIVAARPSMGKAQPLDAKVLTTEGWTTMGELSVGDALASVDGASSQVVGIYPQGERQVYRISLADGRCAECCDEHLWRVNYRGWDEPRVLETAKLREMLGRKRYQGRLWIETFSGEFGTDDGLPMDAWLLGCLIGDGALSGSSVRFTSANEATLEAVEAVLGDGLTLRHAGQYDYRIVQADGQHHAGYQGGRPNPVKEALVGLGLWGCGAAEKFIPAQYLRASRGQRLNLLAGLIDTDGWVERWGSVRLATSSKRLARDVIRLIRSLGGTGSFTRKSTTYTYQGKKRFGLPTYVCNLQHPEPATLVRHPEKRARLQDGRQRQRRLNIVSIEPTRITPTQCIAVSHPSHLYVTDDYIVTHNTAFMLNIAEHIATVNKIPVGVFSLEMSKQQLAQRLLCSRSRVDSQKLRKNMLSRDDFGQLQLTVGELAEAPMYIDDTPGLNLMALRAKARRMATEHHIQCLFVDYLQLMSDPGANSRQEEVSSLSRGIKALAREISVPVICLSQLNRAAEQREGHRPRMSDLRESGSIEQDADVVAMVHREDYYHRSDPDYEPNHQAEIIIAKQRNGPTGVVKLQFHGPTTRFNNLAAGHGDF